MSTVYMPPEHQETTIRLAFSGKMRSGKGEAMRYLNEKYFGDSAKIINFADPLYELCAMIQHYCGFPIEKDRDLLQYIGTNYGRKYNPNVWIERLFKDMDAKYSFNTVMVGDARFINEMDACRIHGIPVIKIQASDEIRLSRGADPDKLNHASELDMDIYKDYDFIVVNDGTKQEFQDKLDIVFGDILTKLTKEAKPAMLCPTGSPLTIDYAANIGDSGIKDIASGLYLP